MEAIERVLRLIHGKDLGLGHGQEQTAQHPTDSAMRKYRDRPVRGEDEEIL